MNSLFHVFNHNLMFQDFIGEEVGGQLYMCHHRLVKLSESLNMAALVEDNEATSKLMPLPEGKTFWDEGAFDAVVKRVEQGKRYLLRNCDFRSE